MLIAKGREEGTIVRLEVAIDLPEDLPEEQRHEAAKAAREAAILTLFRNGAISSRVAASALGLTYRDFLDLLSTAGIPVARGPLDKHALWTIRQKLNPASPPSG